MAGQVQEFPLEEEYKKTSITREDIAQLREWLKTQPHLPEQYITELDLILIYHCCDRSSSVSKQVLDLHYTLKTLFHSFFKNRAFDAKVEKTLNNVLMKPLPTRSHEGYAALFGRLISTDPKNFVLSDIYRSILMTIELWQYEEGTWPGFILLIDLEGLTLAHLAKMDLISLQQFFYYLQEAMLVKLKGFHFLNAPSFMDKLMMLIRPFLKKALLEVFNIHQIGSTTLEKYYPIKALPMDAGGEYKSIEDCKNELLAKMKANNNFFAEENKKRVQESLRPGKPKTITDIFGSIEGSFKKLDID